MLQVVGVTSDAAGCGGLDFRPVGSPPTLASCFSYYLVFTVLSVDACSRSGLQALAEWYRGYPGV